MNITIFALIFDNVGPPLAAMVDALIAALQAWNRPVLLGGILVFGVGRMLWASVNDSRNPIGEMLQTLIAGSVALFVATEAAGYGPYVRDILLTNLSREIGSAILGAVGNRPVTGVLFDEVLARAWAAGLRVLNDLPWSLTGLVLGLFVLAFWVMAAVCTTIAFAVWLMSYVFISVMVGLGPLFVGLFVFPMLRGMFFGWLNTTLSNILLQILTVLLLTLMLGVMSRLLTQLVASANANEVSRAATVVFGGGILFGAFGWFAYQLPGLAATTVAHGFTGFGHLPRVNMLGLLSRGISAGKTQSAALPAALPAPTTPPGRAIG